MNAPEQLLLASFAALLVMVLAPVRRSQPLESDAIIPPPRTPRYGAPPPPALGPVHPYHNGTYPMRYGATYRADFTVGLPAFLVTTEAVREQLEAEGFEVHQCAEVAPARFVAVATCYVVDHNRELPDVVDLHSLERIG